MMFRKLFGLGFLALFFFAFLGLVTSGGRSSGEAAWMQGYIAGQQAAGGGEDGTTVVVAPEFSAGYGRVFGRTHFFPTLLVLTCLVPFFLMGFFFLMGKKHWRHKYGRWHHHGNKAPWIDSDDLSDEPIMKA